MPLSKIPKDCTEEGASATLKAECEEWESKIVKIAVAKCHSLLLFVWFLFTCGFDFLCPYGQYQQYRTAAF